METSIVHNVNTFDTEIASQSSNILGQFKMTKELLPFTVKIARSDEEMQRAIDIRHSAYSRHVPDLAALLKEPEKFDFDDGSIVLLAESKLDGSALGSMRVQTNRYEKLKLESSVTLPEWLQGQSLAEAGRLGIVGNRLGRIVKTILFKAYYLYCLNEGIDWMVITARAPVDRSYEGLLFEDAFESKKYIPIKHDGDMECRIMALNVSSVEPKWKAAKHPLYDLFFHTHHPDIDLHEIALTLPLNIANHRPTPSIGVML